MTSGAVGKKGKGERRERKRREKEKKRKSREFALVLPRGTPRKIECSSSIQGDFLRYFSMKP